MKPSDFEALVEGEIVDMNGVLFTVIKNYGSKVMLGRIISIDKCDKLGTDSAIKMNTNLRACDGDRPVVVNDRMAKITVDNKALAEGANKLYPVDMISIMTEPVKLLFDAYGSELMVDTKMRIEPLLISQNAAFNTKDLVDLLSLAGVQIEFEPSPVYNKAFDYINNQLRKNGVTSFGTDLRDTLTDPLPHDAIYPQEKQEREATTLIVPSDDEVKAILKGENINVIKIDV